METRTSETTTNLSALLDVSRELGGTTELLPLLMKIERAVLQFLKCERSSVFLHDGSSDELYSLVSTGVKSIRFSAKLGIAGEAFQTRSMVIVSDAYADERFNRDIDKTLGFRTKNILTFPMFGHSGDVVGVLQALNKIDGVFDDTDVELAEILGSIAGVGVQRQMLLDEYAEKQQLERDLRIAQDIQQQLLPKTDPKIEGYQIAGFNKPADQTGGDCYDYVELSDGRLGLLMADVTGHGIGPALIAAECRALVRALASTSGDPAQILTRTNHLIHPDLESGRFVTTYLGALDADQHEVEYFSAGHGPIVHYSRSDGACHEFAANTFPLGIVSDMELERTSRVGLAPGDMLVLMTDGFFEWASVGGEQFGMMRIGEIIHACRDEHPAKIIERMHAAVLDFGVGTDQADDLTAMIVKRR
jgi:phosphoserine phosphatase RsbU/P